MRRTLTAALLGGAALLLAALVSPVAQAAAPASSARAGAAWLAGQQQPDGHFPAQFGTAYSATTDAALALAAADSQPSALSSAVSYLANNVSQAAGDPGVLGKTIMVAFAAGRDPRNFGGRDLVADLQATRQPSGLFGSQDPSFDGAFRQSLGLLGLAAVGVRDDAALSWLAGQQCPDGGWQAFRADTSAPCATGFQGPDTNSTGLAVQALTAFCLHAPRGNPLDWLKTVQSTDGGFGYAPGQSTDTNSTALGAQAVLAAGQDPGGSSWTTAGGSSPYSALTARQRSDGSFGYQTAADGPNFLATAQAVPAAAGRPFPLGRNPSCTLPAPVAQASPITTTAPRAVSPPAAVSGGVAGSTPVATPVSSPTLNYTG